MRSSPSPSEPSPSCNHARPRFQCFYSIHCAPATVKSSKSISYHNKKCRLSIKTNIHRIHFAFSRHSRRSAAGKTAPRTICQRISCRLTGDSVHGLNGKPGRAQWLAVPAPFAMMRAAAGRLPSERAPVGAPVAELVDAPDSKSGGFTSVLVRVRPGAPFHLCKILIRTPTQRFPRNFAHAPRPTIACTEMPSAAMRSRDDPQRLGQSGSPARWINRSTRYLFQKHVTAGCVLLRRQRTAH